MYTSEKKVLCCESRSEPENFFSKSSFDIDSILRKTSSTNRMENNKIIKTKSDQPAKIKNEGPTSFLDWVDKKKRATSKKNFFFSRNGELENKFIINSRQDQSSLKFDNSSYNSKNIKDTKRKEINPKNFVNSYLNYRTADFYEKYYSCMMNGKSSYDHSVGIIKNLQKSNCSEILSGKLFFDEKINLFNNQKKDSKLESYSRSCHSHIFDCTKNFVFSSSKTSAFQTIYEDYQPNERTQSQNQSNSMQLGWLSQARMLHPKIISNSLGKLTYERRM